MADWPNPAAWYEDLKLGKEKAWGPTTVCAFVNSLLRENAKLREAIGTHRGRIASLGVNKDGYGSAWDRDLWRALGAEDRCPCGRMGCDLRAQHEAEHDRRAALPQCPVHKQPLAYLDLGEGRSGEKVCFLCEDR